MKSSEELASIFIDKANKVHNGIYDYSKVVYKGCYIKVTVVCKQHGEFIVTPTSHTNKKVGCPTCTKYTAHVEVVVSNITKVHQRFGGKLTLPASIDSIYTKIPVICSTHGVFTSTLSNLNGCGHGCPQCGVDYRTKGMTYSADEFIKKAVEVHGDLYDYSKIDYVDTKTKVTIICKEHGEFSQLPSGHLSGYKCKHCSSYGKGRTKLDSKCTLYYFNIKGTDCYKVGITSVDIRKRYRTNVQRDVINLVFTKDYDTGQEAYNVEQCILKKHFNDRYTGPKLLTQGNTEVFNKDILGSDLSSLLKYEKEINDESQHK